MQTLEFEREREAYIDAAKQLLAPPPTTTEAPAAATGETADVGSERTQDGASGGRGEAWRDGRGDGRRQREPQRHQDQGRQGRHGLPRSRPLPGERVAQSKSASLREAREERRLASEEIRTLQHRKADAKVRLQAERLRYVCTRYLFGFVCTHTYACHHGV